VIQGGKELRNTVEQWENPQSAASQDKKSARVSTWIIHMDSTLSN